MKNYLELENVIKRIFQINNSINILNWDMAVNIPGKSAESRKDEITILSEIAHSMIKSPKVAELIQKSYAESSELNSWQIANVKEIERRYINAESIGVNLLKRYVSSTSICQFVWQETKNTSDYDRLKPYLQEVLDSVNEISQAKAAKIGASQYDALLDTYDPDRKSSEIKAIFNELKRAIPKLLQKVLERQKGENAIPITEVISLKKQKAISKRLMEVLGFDFSSGRIDESAHPFCGGTPHDVRLTTRYNDNLIIGIMNIIHETGHGLYEQGLPLAYRDQPIGKAKGMAIHESQALFWEMQIGRSREFMNFLARLLNDEFGLKGQEYSADNLYMVATRVKRDFIRTDSDEVTYPIHLIIRFEIEEALINGNLSLNELPDCWNQKMQEYFGIRPVSNQEGCMQDIHWPMGLFGYFPTYINGCIIASMTMQKINQSHPYVWEEIEKGELSTLNKFMDTNVRRFGSLKTTQELIKKSTNADRIKPELYLAYLQNKYLL